MSQHEDRRLQSVWDALRNRSIYRLKHARKLRQASAALLCAQHQARTQHEEDALLVHRAWDELAQRAPRVAAALELHHFVGMSPQGVAATMGRSVQTGIIDLRFGRAWLARSLRRAQAAHDRHDRASAAE